MQLAIFVAKAWENNPGQDKIDALAKLMTNLLDTTLLCPEKPFDEALKQFCRNNIPTHSVSPSITLLIAIGYIERLKQVRKKAQTCLERQYTDRIVSLFFFRDIPT